MRHKSMAEGHCFQMSIVPKLHLPYPRVLPCPRAEIYSDPQQVLTAFGTMIQQGEDMGDMKQGVEDSVVNIDVSSYFA